MENQNKIDILFVLPSLRAGGAEKVVSYLAHQIDKNRFQSRLLILSRAEESFFSVEGIETIFLGKSRFRKSIYQLYRYVKLKKPSIVFTSSLNLNLYSGLLKVFFKDIKFITRELSIPSKAQRDNALTRFFKAKMYSKLDAVVFQSQAMRNDYNKTFKASLKRQVVINNPIQLKQKIEITQKLEVPHFISVSSLVSLKGHKRIIQVLEKLQFDFKYSIIGQGVLLNELKQLVQENNLEQKVEFLGQQKNIRDFYYKDSIYLLGSHFEGFPNSVLESLAFGNPVLAFNSMGGHNEMIKNDFNGFICRDEHEFERKISESIKKDWNSAKIQEDAYQRYGSNKIIHSYQELFFNVLKN
jgi:glycosyltransferase involved in cell wall biosynthesis